MVLLRLVSRRYEVHHKGRGIEVGLLLLNFFDGRRSRPAWVVRTSHRVVNTSRLLVIQQSSMSELAVRRITLAMHAIRAEWVLVQVGPRDLTRGEG
jgi:hypothetical protein